MKRVVTAALIFIIISCKNSNYIPRDIIKPPQMQNIFWDIIRGDVLAQEILKNDSTQTIKSANFSITEKIFAIHKINRVQFEKSVTYYEKHPVLIKTIFDSLYSIQTRYNSLDTGKKGQGVKDYHLLRGNKIQ